MKRARRSESALRSLAGDLMSSPAVAAASAAPVREVARLMLDRGVGAVPVLDGSGAAIGMASDGDLLRGRLDDGRRDWCLTPGDYANPIPTTSATGPNLTFNCSDVRKRAQSHV